MRGELVEYIESCVESSQLRQLADVLGQGREQGAVSTVDDNVYYCRVCEVPAFSNVELGEIRALVGAGHHCRVCELNACANDKHHEVRVADKCSSLTELGISGCGKLTDASIAAVADNCSSLAELGVAHCRDLTDAFVAAVAENCLKLTALDVGWCSRLTDTVLVSTPPLEIARQGIPAIRRYFLEEPGVYEIE